jgi:hypothetical protein
MIWNVIINGVFIVVMAVGIVYVWRLQKTLNGLNKNRVEMEKFVADFSASIARAQKAINELQQTARGVGQDVEGQLARAQGLRDELSFLVEAADKIASRLSDSASAAQQDAKLARTQRPEPAQEIKPVEKPLSSIQEVQKQKSEPAVQTKKPEPQPEAAPTKTVPTWIKRVEAGGPVINAPVEAAAPVSGLQFGAKKTKPAEPVAIPAEKEEAKDQPRSLAERELLQALEKMK